MAWKVKKDYIGVSDRRFDVTIDKLTQEQIERLNDGLKNKWFSPEKTKKKKN